MLAEDRSVLGYGEGIKRRRRKSRFVRQYIYLYTLYYSFFLSHPDARENAQNLTLKTKMYASALSRYGAMTKDDQKLIICIPLQLVRN